MSRVTVPSSVVTFCTSGTKLRSSLSTGASGVLGRPRKRSRPAHGAPTRMMPSSSPVGGRKAAVETVRPMLARLELAVTRPSSLSSESERRNGAWRSTVAKVSATCAGSLRGRSFSRLAAVIIAVRRRLCVSRSSKPRECIAAVSRPFVIASERSRHSPKAEMSSMLPSSSSVMARKRRRRSCARFIMG